MRTDGHAHCTLSGGLQSYEQMRCRYAVAEGYLSATSPDERAASLTAALQRLKATSDWLDQERFMRPRVMRSWGHVVGTPSVTHRSAFALPKVKTGLKGALRPGHAAERVGRPASSGSVFPTTYWLSLPDPVAAGSVARDRCSRPAGAAHPAAARLRGQQRGGQPHAAPPQLSGAVSKRLAAA